MLYKVEIKNYSDYADNYQYIVVRLVDGEFWFYGAFDKLDFAKKVALELGNGAVLENHE